MRAIKRVRYGEKELKRLQEVVKKTLEKEEKIEAESSIPLDTAKDIDIDMDNASEKIAENTERSSKTLLDKNGHYPVWMNGRRVRKQKKVVKRLKKSKAKAKK